MSVVHQTCLTVQVPLAIRRKPGRKTLVTPEDKASPASTTQTISTHADPALVKTLARAFRYQRLLDDGQYASITEMADGEKLDRGDMGRLVQLTLLAPNIIEAMLDGRQGNQFDLPSLLKPLPLSWMQQGGAQT
ncbi:hypothetical protein [Muricoccus aerilatus]|uniref:hypothetical protein n=1 Tax=Muricoccus aerilatus TaxID=452982 RepID=UPI0005C176DC|nr:hypothetical protein [Roseomonas aerilata]